MSRDVDLRLGAERLSADSIRMAFKRAGRGCSLKDAFALAKNRDRTRTDATDDGLAVAMATFDGERHVDAQIASIREQTESRWRLLIRDDGSCDATLERLRRAAADPRIEIVEDGRGNLGPSGNFSALAERAIAAGCRYVAFSDQDDVWRPNKLAAQMEQMAALERRRPGAPALVHSDLAVVDGRLNPVAPRFTRYQGVRHEAADPLRVLLVQNFVTGCTMLANRKLLEAALPVPRSALMHDWWLALCAAVFGEIGYVDAPLVAYRQHGSNQIGAKPLAAMLNPWRTDWLAKWRQGRENLAASMRQAADLALRIHALKHAYPDSVRFLSLVEGFADLHGSSPRRRLAWLRAAGVRCQTPPRHLLLLSRLAFL